MIYPRARLCALLAAVLVLRAFVPSGYMLQLSPAQAASGVALVLCPTQNPSLDLARLERSDGASRHQSHAGHAHGAPAAGDGEGPGVDPVAGCGLWLNGANSALAVAPAEALSMPAGERASPARTDAIHSSHPRSDAPARAPPGVG